jgi:CelD/BcsL family acetyltransferase involved in cellulose biosynthesis
MNRATDLELTLYRDESGFAALADEWNVLLRRSRTDTIFLTWEWQTTWWRYVGTDRGPLYLLAARRDGRLVGILPLYQSGDAGPKTLQVVGCIEVSDYLDLIVEAGQEEPVYAAFLDWLNNSAATWDRLDLCNQPRTSLTYTRLAEMARERGWAVEVFQEDVCPIITLPQECDRPGCDDPQQKPPELWEVYLERLDKKERHEIRRKLRRLDREAPDAQMRIVRGGAELDRAMADFIRLHRLSSRDKDAFMTDDMQGFFRAIAAALADRGWLQLSFLEIAGQPVASYFCFDYGNQILVYNSGYDPQASPQLSPGWVLLARLIQGAIAQARTRFDFLQGNEDYKYRFGGVDEPVHRTIVRQTIVDG